MKAPYKLLWLYICDECDHAGVWQVDIEVAQIKIGEKIKLDEALRVLAKQIIPFDNNQKWLIPDFIDFQYGTLNPKNKVHNSVIEILLRYDLIDDNLKIKEYIEWLASPLQGAKDTDKDKDKEKEKDKEGGVGETPVKAVEQLPYRKFAHLSLSQQEFESLKKKYTKDQIDGILNDIQNYKYNTKYTSLYLTAAKWLNKEYPGSNKNGIPTDEW